MQVNNNAEYYYNDPDSTKLSKSPNTIEEDSSGAIMNTVMQLYGDLGDSYAYALYNDQTPTGSSSDSRAHSKGLMLFDGEKGFWMVHSVPKWPGAVSQGWYDISSLTYAQSIMCTTFRLDRLEDIAALQMVQWPLIYSSGISSDLMDDHPQFVEWITGSKNKTATNTTTELVSYNGRHMTHYSTSNYCDCDLWGDVGAWGEEQHARGDVAERQRREAAGLLRPGLRVLVVNITAIAMPTAAPAGARRRTTPWRVRGRADGVHRGHQPAALTGGPRRGLCATRAAPSGRPSTPSSTRSTTAPPTATTHPEPAVSSS